VELDSRVYQAGTLIAWFCDRQEPDLEASLVPLSRWLTATTPRRFDSLSVGAKSAYRYLKIGLQDAFAFPELLPGSIVRVKRLPNAFTRMRVGRTADGRLFLIEYSGGLLCSRLCRPEPRKVVSGIVDLEIRLLAVPRNRWFLLGWDASGCPVCSHVDHSSAISVNSLGRHEFSPGFLFGKPRRGRNSSRGSSKTSDTIAPGVLFLITRPANFRRVTCTN
jgi:hypothetical protein